ncbi:MAG TPA: peptidoglycan-binding domain-containing protein [Terriglobales bacterium]|nr:peptidoglycan-binding domain-containing protein [Terriglobales bacterium]
MRFVRHFSLQLGLILIATLAITSSAFGTTTKKTSSHTTVKKTATTKSKATSHSKSHKKSRRTAKKSWKSRGQQAMSSERAREIQEALIREKYLSGEPTGAWDARTQEACRRYQGDNGWQTKVLPDSRALIKLGLGPDHSKVLNPETAATSPYQPGGGEKISSPESALQPAVTAIR